MKMLQIEPPSVRELHCFTDKATASSSGFLIYDLFKLSLIGRPLPKPDHPLASGSNLDHYSVLGGGDAFSETEDPLAGTSTSVAGEEILAARDETYLF